MIILRYLFLAVDNYYGPFNNEEEAISYFSQKFELTIDEVKQNIEEGLLSIITLEK